VKEPIEAHTVFRWVGREGQYVIGVPTRDLTAADLLEIERREGITEEEIALTGLYERVELAEVEPFCGAPTAEGGRCRRAVEVWGERCYQHRQSEVSDGT